MGSPPTLDPGPARPPDPHRHTVASDGELLEHLQTPAAFGGHDYRHDHTRLATEFTHTHPDLQRDPVRDAEQAFDRLNPDFGVPADHHNPDGRQAVRDREAALSLGVRVAVHDSRQNDRDPVIWQPGQDYRAAEAIHAARHQPSRTRWGPERVGPER
jgi:hypothetical protein